MSIATPWPTGLSLPKTGRGPRRILDQVGAANPIPAFNALRDRLKRRSGIQPPVVPAPGARAASSARRPQFWGTEYLLGLVAECDLGMDSPADSQPGASGEGTESPSPSIVCRDNDFTRHAATVALAHYNKFLADHPDSYWGHYRAAAVSFGLGGRANFLGAANHLEQCLQRRPHNPMLHNHLAASMMVLNRPREAQHEIDLAIEQGPDLAEFYRTRARLRTTLGQTGGLADDLHHFELLRNLLPRRFWARDLDASGQLADASAAPALPFRRRFPSATPAPVGRRDDPLPRWILKSSSIASISPVPSSKLASPSWRRPSSARSSSSIPVKSARG